MYLFDKYSTQYKITDPQFVIDIISFIVNHIDFFEEQQIKIRKQFDPMQKNHSLRMCLYELKNKRERNI